MAITAVGPINVAEGYPGGASAALNVTAAAVLKAAPGVCVRISVITAGSAGTLAINDCTTTGAAATANQFYNGLNASLTQGAVVELDWPCGSGITVSAVPTGSVLAIAFT